jgi:transcriptional regulator with XRE-family HTH domain
MADIGKAPEGFPRLMQAARALAGLTIDQLAEKMSDEDGLSARSLRDIENGTRSHLAPSKRRAILEACDLPPALLEADLWWLQDLADAVDRLSDDHIREQSMHELITDAFKVYGGMMVPAPPMSPGTTGDDQGRGAKTRAALAAGETTWALVEERVREVVQEAVGEQMAVTAATRRTKQLLSDPEAESETESAAAGSTRDEADATSEDAPAPGEARPSSAGRTGQ